MGLRAREIPLDKVVSFGAAVPVQTYRSGVGSAWQTEER